MLSDSAPSRIDGGENMETTSPENVGVSTSRLARVQPAMQSYIDQGRLPGILTMVARRGQVIHSACCGWRDLEAKKPVEIDTLFPIFSMTKPILAMTDFPSLLTAVTTRRGSGGGGRDSFIDMKCSFLRRERAG